VLLILVGVGCGASTQGAPAPEMDLRGAWTARYERSPAELQGACDSPSGVCEDLASIVEYVAPPAYDWGIAEGVDATTRLVPTVGFVVHDDGRVEEFVDVPAASPDPQQILDHARESEFIVSYGTWSFVGGDPELWAVHRDAGWVHASGERPAPAAAIRDSLWQISDPVGDADGLTASMKTDHGGIITSFWVEAGRYTWSHDNDQRCCLGDVWPY